MMTRTFDFSTDPTGALGNVLVPELLGGDIVVENEALTVTLGEPAVFATRIPRSTIQRVERAPDLLKATRGVHGARGRWLVNRSARGLVKISLAEPITAALTMSNMSLPPSEPKGAISRFVLRFVSKDRVIRLRELTIGVDHPDEFVRALGEGP